MSIASFIIALSERAVSVLPVERLNPLMKLSACHRLPELDVSRVAKARMDEVISGDQRERLKHRVEAT